MSTTSHGVSGAGRGETLAPITRRVTRSSSRSVSPATSDTSERSIRKSPSRRAKKVVKEVDEAGDTEAAVALTTPPRHTRHSASKEPEVSEAPVTPTRRSRNKAEAVVPSRPEESEGPLTPTRLTRSAVRQAALAAGVGENEAVTLVNTPKKHTTASVASEAKSTAKSPTRRGASVKESQAPGGAKGEETELDRSVEPNTPRRGRSAMNRTLDSSKLDVTEPTTPTRKGKNSVQETVASTRRTPKKTTKADAKNTKKLTPQSHAHDATPTAAPVKKSEAFKKAALRESLLPDVEQATPVTVRNTPRRSPSRRVKADTEDPAPRQPVRRTPSRRCKATSEVELEPAATMTTTLVEVKTPGVRRSPSRRVKAVAEEAQNKPVAEEPKSSRRARNKPELVVTAIAEKTELKATQQGMIFICPCFLG